MIKLTIKEREIVYSTVELSATSIDSLQQLKEVALTQLSLLPNSPLQMQFKYTETQEWRSAGYSYACNTHEDLKRLIHHAKQERQPLWLDCWLMRS